MQVTGADVIGGSWPVHDQHRHFDLGHVLNCVVTDALVPVEVGALAAQHSGLWECDLADEKLIWSGGVYDMFGLERGVTVSRELALAHYAEESRAKLERLRSHAIKRGLGFTLDVDIRSAAVGRCRRLRLIAAPLCSNGETVRLHGIKLVL